MAYEAILYDVRDRIATITLNRPDRLNAWTRQMAGELRDAMHKAAADDGVRAILLTGAGRGFCAGADMNLLSGLSASKGASHADEVPAPRGVPAGGSQRPDFQLPNTYFPAIPKPILGAINGPCAGLGFVVSLFCDFRFAAESAVFTTAFAQRGLVAEHGISWTLPRLVGLPNAADLLYSARKVRADEALRLGIVQRVVPDAQLLDAAHSYLKGMADTVSPRSLAVMKRQIWEGMFQTLAEANVTADHEMALSLASEDFKEGVAHFLEKRAPQFTGR